ncbi:unnamed protein product, partial [marine sediment metagenome]
MEKEREEKLTQAREKRLRELTERSLKIILTPKKGFEDKSYKELESMQRDLNSLIETLKGYRDMLGDMKNFKILWDSIKNKGDYLTVFNLFESNFRRIDDIPF